MQTRVLAAVLTAVALTAAVPAAAQQNAAEVFVVHGIPGDDLNQPRELRVDISVNGACAITQLPFKGIVGPLHVPPGVQQLAVHYPATGTCASAAVIGPAGVPFFAGESATVIAHLSADGAPAASKFVNNLSSTAAGRARVSVHHTAAAPAVDVYLTTQFGNPLSTRGLVSAFVHGEQAMLPVTGQTVQFAVTVAGTTTAAFGPVGLGLAPNRAYLLYVVGSVARGTIDVIAKDVSELR